MNGARIRGDNRNIRGEVAPSPSLSKLILAAFGSDVNGANFRALYE